MVLRSVIAMDTASAGVTRADQRGMSKSNSVAFIKVRKRVQALATQHATAIAALKASGTSLVEVGSSLRMLRTHRNGYRLLLRPFGDRLFVCAH